MAGTSTLRAGIAALVLLAALIALAAVEGVAVAGPRGETDSNRALVVIDDGVTRTEACVFFAGTIDGIDALEHAGTETVLTGFGGMGSAVCALNGVGCSASSCLTCQAPKFWHYLRADEGSSSFTTSPLGAGASKVENGDVELWMWGGSIAPPEVPSVDAACGPLVTTTTITVRPSPTTTAAPRPGGGAATSTPTPIDPPGSAIPAPAPFLTPPTTVASVPSPSTPEVVASTPTDGGTPPSTEGGDASDDAATSNEDKETSARGAMPTADHNPAEGESAAAGKGDGEVAAGPAVGGGASAPGGGWLGVATVLVLVGGLAIWATALRRRSRA